MVDAQSEPCCQTASLDHCKVSLGQEQQWHSLKVKKSKYKQNSNHWKPIRRTCSRINTQEQFSMSVGELKPKKLQEPIRTMITLSLANKNSEWEEAPIPIPIPTQEIHPF